MLSHILTATALFAVTALTSGPSARVVIETSHGGAGNGLVNQTVTIPINSIYKNSTALDQVSTLYLVGSSGTPFDSINCLPWSKPDGSGKSGLPFNSTSPSYLSTNDVDVGSIVCTTNAISAVPPGAPGSQSSSGSSGSIATSTTLVTQTPSTHTVHSTVTSVTAASLASATAATAAAATASQSAGNAASGLYLSGEFFGGLALAGFGLAFAL